MAVVVPGQGGDGVAGPDAQLLQGVRELVHSRRHVAVGGAMDLVLALGDDLLAPEEVFQAPEHVVEGERVVLHAPDDGGAAVAVVVTTLRSHSVASSLKAYGPMHCRPFFRTDHQFFADC